MDPIIFHIDVNSAFLSWSAAERLQNGETADLRLIPSIVGGDIEKRHGVVLAKSIPAKAYGITTGEPVVNALRKCPSLTIVSPDHAMYEQKSHMLMSYLLDICPDIEQASIDECYLDFSSVAHRYPSPEAAAHTIKDEIRSRFGFTVNVGISDRKVLAKWHPTSRSRIWCTPCTPGRSARSCGPSPSPPCSCAADPVWKSYINWKS